MSHSPPRGYGLVNTFDLPGDDDDIDTKIRCSTQNLEFPPTPRSQRVSTNSSEISVVVPSVEQHEYSAVATSDLVLPTLNREISIGSPRTPKISPRQRKHSNVKPSDLAPPPNNSDHEYYPVPSSDPRDIHILPPVQTSRKNEQHAVIALPTPSPKSAKKFRETYGYFPANSGEEAPIEHPTCWDYVNAPIVTCLICFGILLLICAAPNIPIVRLDSLSVVKFNATKPHDTKVEVKGTWDLQITIKNYETKWRGLFRDVNCTVYKQHEHRNFYEEEAGNLRHVANTSIAEGFSMEPEAEKELQMEMEVAGMQDLESATFVLWVSADVSFNRSSFEWYSGTLNYNCGTIKIDQDTGTLAHRGPVLCKFTLPLR